MLAKNAADRPTMAQVAGELQERLPARSSSRSLQPIPRSPSSDILEQEALEPTEDAPSQEGAKDDPSASGGPARARAAALRSGVPAAESSGQSGAGTITRATGQGISVQVSPARTRSLLLPIAVFTLVAGAGGAAWLLSPKQATIGQPTATTAQPPTATPTNAAPASPPAGPRAGAASSPPAQAGESASTLAESGTTRKDTVSGPQTGESSREGKSTRSGSSAKKSERKKGDKPRRSPALKATPIMD